MLLCWRWLCHVVDLLRMDMRSQKLTDCSQSSATCFLKRCQPCALGSLAVSIYPTSDSIFSTCFMIFCG